ncbi:MAG: type II toxin-antitoxin system VapC family toxin [Bacillota bacterium]|nr:type II toxin-antitoxin system VapC family toxin [Bacillota bacterium]
MKYLLDSNILIYHLNGESTATDFILENLYECGISQITFVEILSFDFTEQEAYQVETFLNCFEIIDTSKDIARQCIKNRKIKRIKIPDNFIAATAQVNDLILVTRNTDDFKQLDLNLKNIF